MRYFVFVLLSSIILAGCAATFPPDHVKDFRLQIMGKETVQISAGGMERQVELTIEEESRTQHLYGYIPIGPTPETKVFVNDKQISAVKSTMTDIMSTTFIAKFKRDINASNVYKIRIEGKGESLTFEYRSLHFKVTAPDRFAKGRDKQFDVQLEKNEADSTNISFTHNKAPNGKEDLCTFTFAPKTDDIPPVPKSLSFSPKEIERSELYPPGSRCKITLSVLARAENGSIKTRYNPVKTRSFFRYEKDLVID